MKLTVECPECSADFKVDVEALAKKVAPLKCTHCGAGAAPDIQTAYENVGKSLSELCSCCEESAEQWLPKEVEAVKTVKGKK